MSLGGGMCCGGKATIRSEAACIKVDRIDISDDGVQQKPALIGMCILVACNS